MDPLQLALSTVLAPATLAGVILVLGAAIGRSPGTRLAELSAPRAASLALAGAFVLGFGLILGLPALPPVDVTQVGPWAALAAVPLAWLTGRWRAVATGVLALALGFFLAAPALGGGALFGYAALIAATAVIVERGVSLIGASEPGRTGAAVTLLFVSGVSAVVLLSDVASLAMTTGALAAGLGAMFTLSFVAPRLAVVERAAPVIALVAVTQLFSANLYANAHLASVLMLVAMAPLSYLCARLVAAPSRRWVASVGLGLLLVGGASALAATRYFAAPSDTPAGSAAGADEDYGY